MSQPTITTSHHLGRRRPPSIPHGRTVNKRKLSSSSNPHQQHASYSPYPSSSHSQSFRNNHSNSNNFFVLTPSWATVALAAIPVVIWCRDNFVDLVVVRGSSMAPTLQPGDVILVRKAEPGVLLTFLPSLLFGSNDDDSEPTEWNDAREEQQQQRQQQQQSTGSASSTTSDSSTSLKFLTATEVALLKSRIHHYERLLKDMHRYHHHHQGGHMPTASSSQPFAWLYHKPPLIIPGQVICITSPEHYPSETHVKRVVGIGGQWLQPEEPEETDATRQQRNRRRLQLLPPYSVYVQGDNQKSGDSSQDNNNNNNNNNSTTASRDSRHYGPLSQNLYQGHADAIVWPPRRWQRLKVAATPTDARGRPRVFWRR